MPDTVGADGRKAPDAAPARKSRLRKALRLLLWAAVFIAAAHVAVSYIIDYWGSSKFAHAQALVRQAGLPLTYEDPEYAAWQNVYFDETSANAAVYYEAAYSLLRPLPEEETLELLPIVGKAELPTDPRAPLAPDAVSRMRDYIFARTRILDILHEASRLRACKYTIDWDACKFSLPHHSGARRAAGLLAVAICLDAEANRPSDSVERVRDGLAVARSLWDEPIGYSWIIGRNTYDKILCSGLERLLAETDPSDEDLVDLQSDIAEAADKFSVKASFVGEIVSWTDSFQRLTDGRVETVDAFNDNGEPRTPIELAKLKFIMWSGRGTSKSMWAGHTLALLKMTEYASDPTPEVLRRAADSRMYNEIAQNLRTWPFVNEGMILPSWPRTIQEGESLRARLRAAAACIAALRYRNHNGAWPADLNALVPAYLAAVPVDPFTGSALVYKVSDDGIMAYSVGPDLKDDEGKPNLQIRPEDVKKEEWEKYDDSGFRIWK